MKGKNLQEADHIIMWLQLPIDERSPLSKKQYELLERWNVADNLLREHMSERKVIPMLVTKFGYSESSARRDLDCAQRVWGTRPRRDKEYLANMLVDYLTEQMVRAGKADKFDAVARIAKVILEAGGVNKADASNEPPGQTTVLLMPLFEPSLVGGTEMNDEERSELVQKAIAQKTENGFIEPSLITRLAKSAR